MTPTCDPQAAADFLRALAHPMRLRILCRLVEGELPVSGFETELGLKQPNLSQQLSHLRDAELVTTRRDGKSIFYSLADQRVGVLLDALRAIQEVQPEPPTSKPDKKTPVLAGRLARQTPRPQPDQAPAKPEECGRFAVAGWTATPQGARR